MMAPMESDLRDRLRRISSRQNSLVKDLRRAFSRAEPTDDGHCAIEGIRLLEDAIRSGMRFKAVFFRESSQSVADRLMPQLASQVETAVLPDDVFESAVATETPQGVAALVKVKTYTLEDALRADEPVVLAAAGIQDPGNLGTMLRSAEAFAASGALLGEGTVSQFNPKAIRASAGSVFRLPVVRVELAGALEQMKTRGLRLVGTSSHKGTPAPTADLSGPLALVIGSEGAGLPREIAARLDETVAVPHSPRVESLNAAIAASILLYEAARQRNIHHGGTEEMNQ
jgi:TrmH family RNA methyltransferase